MRLIVLLLLLVASPLLATQPPQVLIVAANESFDLGELAVAHEVFERNGFSVEIGSPAGGAIRAKKAARASAAVDTFMASRARMLEATRPVGAVDAASYELVFLVGGSGAMLEFPAHEPLRRKIEEVAARGGVVAAVCHGAAALVDVRLANGRRLIDGKRVTSFTEEEESRFGGNAAASYPFVLEQALRARGASFAEAGVMLVHVVIDGKLVTGQNPFSTARAADEAVRATGRTPRSRTIPADEATMLLIDEISRDERQLERFHEASGRYDAQLLAIYGSLLAESARSHAEVKRAILLLEAGRRYIQHPRIDAALARARRLLEEFGADDHRRPDASPADRRRE
jgi:putative intracellular protease/amidase